MASDASLRCIVHLSYNAPNVSPHAATSSVIAVTATMARRTRELERFVMNPLFPPSKGWLWPALRSLTAIELTDQLFLRICSTGQVTDIEIPEIRGSTRTVRPPHTSSPIAEPSAQRVPAQYGARRVRLLSLPIELRPRSLTTSSVRGHL